MWILKWLPDWFFYILLLIGVVGYFATYLLKYLPLPFVSMYRLPIQLVSIVCIVIGTFMAGSIHDNNAWLEKVQEMEAKVAVAEAQSADANKNLASTIATKNKETFNQNFAYYIQKWGGPPGAEKYETPFDMDLPIDYWLYDPRRSERQRWI